MSSSSSSSSVPLKMSKRKNNEMESLGFDLKFNILSGLPIETLLQLRSCNKAFRDFIDDPNFRKLYSDHVILASQSITNPVSFLTLIQFNDQKDCAFHFGEYDDVGNEYTITEPMAYPHVNLRNKGDSCRIIVGSCNGLVCYSDSHTMEFPPIYILNPVTRERLNLTPLRPVTKERDRVVNGFGYHPVTKEYKVVRIHFNGQENADGEVDVYTLGTGEWRRVGKVPSLFNVFSRSSGVLVNGALHWYDIHNRIASFDLATETFKHVPSPSNFELEPVLDHNSYDLWAWKESLCVVNHDYPGGILDIWVRNNNDQSWEEELSVPFMDVENLPLLYLDVDDLAFDDCTFITCTESGKVLQWYNDKLLASYDLEKEERTVYGENKTDYFNDIVLHVKSFVSIKDLGEDSEIMESKDLCFLTLIQIDNEEIDNEEIDNEGIDNEEIDNEEIDNEGIDNEEIDNEGIDNEEIDNEGIDNEEIDNEEHGRFYLAEYDDVTNEYMVTQPVTHPPLNLMNKEVDNIIIGSCNGLVCYADHRRIKFDPIYVFNPVTRELLNLTPLGSVKKLYSHVKNGFGYHPVTKEYKVVRIYYEAEKGAAEVEVYTLGTGEWRRVGKVPQSLFNVFQDFPGVLVNGALHWVDYKGSIASFDLATEIFKEVPSPSSLTLVPDEYNLCALREHLCVIHHFKDSRIDIWELNVDQSWRMEFSFAVNVEPPLCVNDKSLKHASCTPVTFTNSGKLLLWHNHKVFASYDPENQETISHNVCESDHFNEIVVHVKSSVSMKALGEKNSKLIRIPKPRVQ